MEFSPTVIYTLSFFLLLYVLINVLSARRGRLPPGPKPWPIVGNLPHLGPVPHHSIAALASKYGPLMYLRLGFVKAIVVASASVAAQLFKTHDANFSSRPPNSGAKHMAYNYQDLVFAPYGPRWRLLRKISQVHLFSVKALDDFRHIREEEVAVLVKKIVHAGRSAVKLAQPLNVCTANALGRAMVGRRVLKDDADDPKADEFKNMVVEMMVLAGVFNIGDFVPVLECLDLQGVAAKMKKLHQRMDAFLTDIVRNHTLAGKERHADLLSTLISLRDNPADHGERITDVEIKALLLNMFTAGTDTSSSTVEWGIAELLRHPQVMAEVQREIDAVVGRERLVSDVDLNNLPYFQAVLKEIFRLHPSTPLSLPRIAENNCEVNGYLIPKGATVLVNVWAIARDPELWADPLKFKPERFMPGGENRNVDMRGNHFELIPFGAGRRICAGMSLGIRMVQLMLATLVHAFDFELADGLNPDKLNMEEAYGLTLQRAQPLVVIGNTRLHPIAYKM